MGGVGSKPARVDRNRTYIETVTGLGPDQSWSRPGQRGRSY